MFMETARQFPPGLPFVPMTIGETPIQNYIERPYGFELNQFLWVTQGEGMAAIGGRREPLSVGRGLFFRKGVPHSYQGCGGVFSTRWLSFLSGEELLARYGVGDFFFFQTPAFLNDATAQLEELCAGSFSQILRAAHGYVWAATLLESLFKGDLSLSEQAVRFLEHNCHRPLTLDQVAEELGVGKFSLCRLYMRDTGETVMQTLKRLRVQKAKKFLRYSTYSIEEVGRLCGYESPSYFIKVFREEVGRTPGQYRKSRG